MPPTQLTAAHCSNPPTWRVSPSATKAAYCDLWPPPSLWSISAARGSRHRVVIAAGKSGGVKVEEATANSLAGTEADSQRLFSNLNPKSLKHEPGTLFSAAALVTGTTVGAGILALPAVTAPSGFIASSAGLAALGLYSTATGLLIAEVNLNTLGELGAGSGVSLGTMARRTLGSGGAAVVSTTYLLIHYALLVAYIAKAGETLQNVTGLPPVMGDALFAAAVGGLCWAVRPAALNQINTTLVVLFVASFLGLVGLAAGDLHPQQLAVAHWEALPDALPVLALAYVYQNVVPVITTSLEGDVAKVRKAIVLGVAVPWLMFEAWLAAVLGGKAGQDAATTAAAAGDPTDAAAAAAIQATDAAAIQAAASPAVIDPLAMLRETGGSIVTPLIDTFTLLAVLTSAIGFILGLSGFMADALRLPSGTRQALPYLLTVVPPLACAAIFPDVFFSALDFAGTYGVLTLFGVLPAAMAWSERYGGAPPARITLVPGGRPVLLAIAAMAAGIIARELLLASGQL